MTALVWDRVEDRRFEIGIDRGVLFPVGSPAEVWNGLVSVTETRSREVKSYYIDGVKYLDHFVPGSYAGTIQAFTYPDVFEEILGTAKFAPGVNVHDQRAGMFHLSYRTRIGDVLEGLDAAYKLHLVYNLTANPKDATFSTVSDSVDPNVFEWDISAVPSTMWGIRPTSHLSFDSRLIDPALLLAIENQVYGTPGTDPVMPDLVDLLSSLEAT